MTNYDLIVNIGLNASSNSIKDLMKTLNIVKSFEEYHSINYRINFIETQCHEIILDKSMWKGDARKFIAIYMYLCKTYEDDFLNVCDKDNDWVLDTYCYSKDNFCYVRNGNGEFIDVIEK